MKKKMRIKLERKEGKIAFNLKIPKEIENLYKKLSGDKTQKSNVWFDKSGEGIDFYAIAPEILTIEDKIDKWRYFDEFGNGLFGIENRINLAPLRCVGASKGVYLTSTKFVEGNNFDLETYIRDLSYYVKKLWEQAVSKQKITAVVSFEV